MTPSENGRAVATAVGDVEALGGPGEVVEPAERGFRTTASPTAARPTTAIATAATIARVRAVTKTGARSPRLRGGTAAPSEGSARKTETGSRKPLRRRVPAGTARTSAVPRRSERTTSLTRTSFGPAAEASRAARLTALPTDPSAVSTVSPKWTPMPTAIGSAGSVTDASRAAPAIAMAHMVADETEGKTT